MVGQWRKLSAFDLRLILDTLIYLLRQEYRGAGHLAFTKELEATGLFDEWEEAGVLPTAPAPNPFDNYILAVTTSPQLLHFGRNMTL